MTKKSEAKSPQKYSGVVLVDKFFPKKRGKGSLKKGDVFESESKEAIDHYKRIKKLK